MSLERGCFFGKEENIPDHKTTVNAVASISPAALSTSLGSFTPHHTVTVPKIFLASLRHSVQKLKVSPFSLAFKLQESNAIVSGLLFN